MRHYDQSIRSEPEDFDSANCSGLIGHDGVPLLLRHACHIAVGSPDRICPGFGDVACAIGPIVERRRLVAHLRGIGLHPVGTKIGSVFHAVTKPVRRTFAATRQQGAGGGERQDKKASTSDFPSLVLEVTVAVAPAPNEESAVASGSFQGRADRNGPECTAALAARRRPPHLGYNMGKAAIISHATLHSGRIYFVAGIALVMSVLMLISCIEMIGHR